MVPSGTCGRHAAAGLRASPDGGHEEVDGSAGEERAGFLCAAALHGCHRGEDGALPARCGTGLHQSAQQGEAPDSNTTLCNFKRRIKKVSGMNTESAMFELNNLASNTKSGTDEIELTGSPPKCQDFVGSSIFCFCLSTTDINFEHSSHTV